MGPLVFAENWAIFDNVLIGSQENVERVSQSHLEITANSRRSFIGDNSQSWCPLGEFETPVRQGREGNDDKIGARLVFTFN
jgi:hypothetical protein